MPESILATIEHPTQFDFFAVYLQAWHKKILAICVFGSSLLVCTAIFVQAPTSDEYGHLYAGLCYWQQGDTAMFNVNSPFVRSLGALPGFFWGLESEKIDDRILGRQEFQLGRRLFISRPQLFFNSLRSGRILVSSFCLLATVLIYRFTIRCSGLSSAGLMAVALWSYQPQVVAHSALITSDIACSALMFACVCQLIATMNKISIINSFLLGALLGAAVLSKFTGLILLPIVFCSVIRCADRASLSRLCAAMGVIMVTFALVVSIPYRFEGVGKMLVSYTFVSFAGSDLQNGLLSSIGYLPVPLPQQLLLGIDRQQLDFERGLPSYAAGYHGSHGWWWFYLYSMLVKLPVGTLLSIFAAIIAAALGGREITRGLGILVFVLGSLIVVTCWQDGFSQQHRYIFAIYPFLFAMVGVIGARACQSKKTLFRLPIRCFGYAIGVGSTLTVFACCSVSPNWMSAFNSIAGGNSSGYRCLFNDASDWGQDTYRVAAWINRHQSVTPIFVQSSFGGLDELKAAGAGSFRGLGTSIRELPRPCWLVVSKSDYVINPLLQFELDVWQPIETVGGTHLVFHFN